MRILYARPIATSLVGAACSGDDGGSPLVDAGIDSPNPDAPPGGACGTIATTLSTYPANYAGSTATSGADFTVAEARAPTRSATTSPLATTRSSTSRT